MIFVVWMFPVRQGFSGAAHEATSGPLRVSIAEVDPVTEYGKPVTVRVTVGNSAETAVQGNLIVGGPTEGIRAEGQMTRTFNLRPGDEVEEEFRLSFDESCISALYPVHAFAGLEDGSGAKIHAVRLVKTEFPDREIQPSHTLVSFRPDSNGPDTGTTLALERKSLVTELIGKNSDSNPERLIFRIGGEENLTLLLSPGENGLLDGALAILGNEKGLWSRGLAVDLKVPAGLELGDELEVAGFDLEAREDGVDVTHRLRCGEFTTVFTVSVTVADGLIRLKPGCVDSIEGFALGSWSEMVETAILGTGYRLVRPGEVRIEGNSPLLASHATGLEFANGLALVQAAGDRVSRIKLSREDRLGAVVAAGEAGLIVVPSGKDAYAAAGHYRRSFDPVPGTHPLAGRMWIRVREGSYGDTAEHLRQVLPYGAKKLAIVMENWQAGGPETSWPDVWPPDETRGTLADLQHLAKLCREQGIFWGVTDRYDVIHPEADGFGYDQVKFAGDGRPVRRDRGERVAFPLRSDLFQRYLERNLQLVRYYLTPNLCSILGAPVRPRPYFGKDGNWIDAEVEHEGWEKALEFAKGYLGGGSVCVAESGGDWLRGSVDALAVEAFTGELDVERIERVPWLDFLFHERLPVRESLDTAEDNWDDRVSLEMMCGWMPVLDERHWGRDTVRRYWLVRAVTEAMGGMTLEEVTPELSGPGRVRCDWSGGLTAWVNRGEENWEVEGRVLPEFGYLVKAGPAEASFEKRAGREIEQLTMPGLWVVNVRQPGEGRVEFPWGRTNGGFRMEKTAAGLRLVPLPESATFLATLNLEKLGLDASLDWKVWAWKQGESKPGKALASQRDSWLSLEHDPDFFYYDIVPADKQ